MGYVPGTHHRPLARRWPARSGVREDAEVERRALDPHRVSPASWPEDSFQVVILRDAPARTLEDAMVDAEELLEVLQ